jgi:hypothetical protein
LANTNDPEKDVFAFFSVTILEVVKSPMFSDALSNEEVVFSVTF